MSEALAEGLGAGAATDATEDGGTTPPEQAAIVETPAAPAFDYNDPRFAEAVDTRAVELAEQLIGQRIGPLEEMLRSALVDENGAPADAGDLNPWGDQFGTSLENRFKMLEERMMGAVQRIEQPIIAREMAEISAEGEARLKDMVADDVARNGDFPRMVDPATGQPVAQSKAEEAVIPLARMLFPEVEQRFGRTPRAAEIAVSRASQLVRDICTEAAAHALHGETNRLTALANANGEPGATAVLGVRALPEANTFSEVTRRHTQGVRDAARGTGA